MNVVEHCNRCLKPFYIIDEIFDHKYIIKRVQLDLKTLIISTNSGAISELDDFSDADYL